MPNELTGSNDDFSSNDAFKILQIQHTSYHVYYPKSPFAQFYTKLRLAALLKLICHHICVNIFCDRGQTFQFNILTAVALRPPWCCMHPFYWPLSRHVIYLSMVSGWRTKRDRSCDGWRHWRYKRRHLMTCSWSIDTSVFHLFITALWLRLCRRHDLMYRSASTLYLTRGAHSVDTLRCRKHYVNPPLRFLVLK